MKNRYLPTFPIRTVSEDRGAVLIYLAVILVVLIGFVGMGIDSSVLGASESQQRHTAEYLALTALRTFSGRPATEDIYTRLFAARDHAQQVAGANIMLAEPFLYLPAQPEELGPLDDGGGGTVPDGPNGRIAPGLWYFVPPASCALEPTPCPCDTSGNWAGPCFRELDFDDPAQQTIVPNAFRAELHLRPESPLRTFFMRVLGAEFVSVASSATAATVPTHGVLLTDLSRSSAGQNHRHYEAWGAEESSEYAFQLKNKTCLGPSDHTNPCQTLTLWPGAPPPPAGHYISCGAVGDALGPPTDCEFMGKTFLDLYTAIYNSHCNSPPPLIRRTRGATTTPIHRHFKDDYACYTVNYQDGNESPVTEHYLIDTYRSVVTDIFDPAYTIGPEPLSTMLYGMHYALDRVTQRNVIGDMIGAVGFDQSAWIRSRKFPLSRPGLPDYESLKRITDVDNQTPQTLEERFQTHLFFPRVDALGNIPGALTEAVNMLLTASDRDLSQKFVVLITDGISFCQNDASCDLSATGFQNSFNEAASIVQNQFVPNGIKLHVVFIGRTGGPHTLLVQSSNDPTECMEEGEARFGSQPIPLVDVNAYTDTLPEALTDETKYFFPANQYYNLARMTDGIWGPVRPCFPVSGTCTDLTITLNSACEAGSPGTSVTLLPYTDNYGRLQYDPLGRHPREQFEEYIEQVLSNEPYVLVQ